MPHSNHQPQTHRIRLRGPWQAKVVRSVSHPELSDVMKRQMPPSDWGAWLGEAFTGTVRYERRFGLPTGLNSGDSIQLVVAAVDYHADVELNGHQLGGLRYPDRGEFQVLPLLCERNRLVLTVTLLGDMSLDDQARRADRQGQAGGLVGEVYLEIVSTSSGPSTG